MNIILKRNMEEKMIYLEEKRVFEKQKQLIRRNQETYALPIFRFFFNDLFDLFYFFGTF